MWDPHQYVTFAAERGRPFRDLMAQVGADGPAHVVDLGCGPGTLTVELAARWPRARVRGVDSSPDMIAATPRDAPVEFELGDVRDWSADRPVDVLVSNATLQWVPGHLDLLPRLSSQVADGGWLAFQVPANFGEPAHVLLREQAASPRWGMDVAWPAVHEPATYLAALLGLGLRADVWETTYLHLLPGEDAVLSWMTGTGLRPVLARLDESAAVEFTAEYAAALRQAYPTHDYGTVLPYRRVFAVAHKAVRT